MDIKPPKYTIGPSPGKPDPNRPPRSPSPITFRGSKLGKRHSDTVSLRNKFRTRDGHRPLTVESNGR
ncbi:hypothetical protein M413DRAFT_450030 [Hebeloma cylindrosporum]|uniref:Uncharacterized protein n=1 Tax=Hebeloma cylindrosporum TaxID=76867 RepID=A0A0C2XA02_HEBCY|nr:hypothetical protein M413DRAFT_450030 [Hebeloma cylindrosporum h7]